MPKTQVHPLQFVRPEVPITESKALHGGCISSVTLLTFADDIQWVVKSHTHPQQSPSFQLEGRMLNYLKDQTSLPVPKVFSVSDTHLAMAFLPGKSRFSLKSEEDIALQFVHLHQNTAPRYGFHETTVIGGIPQPNPWTDSWISFFRDHRLLAFTEQAHRNGGLPTALRTRLETLCENLSKHLEEPRQPALLHGDAWTTNILANENHLTGVLDPALYYGHPEIELAFTTLFNTFSPRFYDVYHHHSAIAPGFFEERKTLYNLYPLLVHVCLFGSGYNAQIDQSLTRLGH